VSEYIFQISCIPVIKLRQATTSVSHDPNTLLKPFMGNAL